MSSAYRVMPVSLKEASKTDFARSPGRLLTDFVFPWEQKQPPATRFKAWYTPEHLYFFFSVEDLDVVLAAGNSEAEAAVQSDRVELFFACNDSLNPYYALEMDPRGWVFYSRGTFYRQLDTDWRWPGLIVEGKLVAGGYEVRGSIPMASLDSLNLWQDEAQTQWKVAVLRAEFSHGETGDIQHSWISWQRPDSPHPDFHIPSAFGDWVLSKTPDLD
ncbi:MAG: sugar-binding protein [Bacteroidota bacterium]